MLIPTSFAQFGIQINLKFQICLSTEGFFRNNLIFFSTFCNDIKNETETVLASLTSPELCRDRSNIQHANWMVVLHDLQMP